jgi:glucose/arabinose dehydrogenase
MLARYSTSTQGRSPRRPRSMRPSWMRSSGCMLVAGVLGISGCAHKDQNARDTQPGAATAASEAPEAVAEPTAPDLASATPERPLRPQAPSEPGRNGVRSKPDGPLALGALQLPAGFSLELYSGDVPKARSLALGPKGTVFVSTREDDKVYALVDSNGDHKVDHVHVIASGLDTPNGIAYQKGSLYIAEVGRLLRLDDIDTHLEHPPQPVVVTDQLPKEKHHGWRYLRFGPDGWLYMPIGAPCNVCERDEPVFATMSRIKTDGTGLEVFAKGVRNSVGFDWHPGTKELWFTENGRDELGDDLPPDELNRAPRAGLDFGFPHCHAGVIVDPEFGKGHTCTEYEPPVQKLGAHVAALGMRFYTGKMFPPRYQNAIILAEHGSWNRSRKLGYRVMVVRLEGNQAVSYEPLISGWLDEAADKVSGRPVDVEVLDDGSLLVSDDFRGAVYRLTYRG